MPLLPKLSPRVKGILAAVVTIGLWTAFIVIARALAHRSLNPMDIVFARALGAGAVLLPWGWWLARRQRQQAHAGDGAATGTSFFGLSPLPLRATVLAGLPAGLLYSLFAYAGFVYAPAAHASVLMPGSLPMWTALITLLVLREPLPRARLAGVGLIMLGGLLVGGWGLLQAFEGGEVWKGDLLFALAGITWASYGVIVRQLRTDAVRTTIAVTVFAVFSFMPVYLLAVAAGWLSSRLLEAPPGEVLFQALFQGVASVVISGITFTTMLRYFGPLRSTMMTSLVPGLSALGAVIFLGEPLGWNLVLGLALVTGGMLFGIRAAVPAGGPAVAAPAKA